MSAVGKLRSVIKTSKRTTTGENLAATPFKETEQRGDSWHEIWNHEQTEIIHRKRLTDEGAE